MWARLVVAPWWVLWLVNAATFTITLSVICGLGLPGFAASGWAWPLLSVLLFSVIVTALLTRARRPIQQSYARTVTGLDLAQRSQAVKALRRGEVPTDPAVLAAAVRIGELSMAYQRRVPVWQRRVAWIVPVLWGVAAVLEFLGNDARAGLTWSALASLVAARMAWATHKARQLPTRVAILRSAADSSPQTLSVLAGAHDCAAPPPDRRFRLSFAVVVVIAVAGAVFAVYEQGGPSRDCRTADAVVGFIHEHPGMLDASLITPGGPGLDKYQDWSDRLVAYSQQASAPDIAQHLQRIAKISTDAVAVVTEARRDSFASQSTDEMLARQATYHGLVSQLVDEDKALIPPCHPHR
ncbi:MAG: hypothetical protein VYA67_01450 [Actinomycetota bacterium]|uniref:Integral membrane protein n=1 Tax=Mycobacterium lentiflavum TaxID=141349 RepID=A0ABY3V2S1_MYCLN|nr:hypothetical protein [Mycobacterium lentiflavum]MEE3062617.1 hypothetical protein [Actinomycetota bacterium]ULP43797.1 hypothetical protein MJO58_07520 [Mycobacterium lentiflavum]